MNPALKYARVAYSDALVEARSDAAAGVVAITNPNGATVYLTGEQLAAIHGQVNA